jgi:V8-like Glu-specific endopeptidase
VRLASKSQGGPGIASHFLKMILVLTVLAGVSTTAQTPTPKKDIPTIAKAASGAIVSIVMSDKDGKPLAQGTGFLVSKDGIIVTNYHVIAEGASAIVKFPDAPAARSQGFDFGFGTPVCVVDGVVASDKARDMAVIKARGRGFRTLTLGNSDRVQVGEAVVAIGNPLSLESTVSNGIVSARRTVKEEGGDFLQITAPISPGSSGGPLFNMSGEVIGITTMYLKGGENLNFAIPINDVKQLLANPPAKLQHLPNEVENAENAAKPAFDRYHVIAYDPNSHIVLVRYGKKLFTASISKAEICDSSSVGEFNEQKDCKGDSSIAEQLVGQDILTPKEDVTINHDRYGKYIVGAGPHLVDMRGFLQLDEFMDRKPDGGYSKFRMESWRIQKIEEISHE